MTELGSDAAGAADAAKLHLCVMLWAREGMAGALADYEDQVLALLPAHGGRVVNRVRTRPHRSEPDEVHVLEFPDEAALDAYLNDDRRLALADLRERTIARTDILRVTPV